MKLQKDPFYSFTHLPLEIETKLRANLRVFSFTAGETIFIQGASPTAVYLVANGRAKIVRFTYQGQENVLCIREAGGYFCPVPLLDRGVQLGTAVAITDVTLFSIEREVFTDLCYHSPQLLSIVQADCLAQVRHLLNRLETFAFHTVKERLAITLLEKTQEYSPAAPLRLTQQDLAGLVGASRETVSRLLKDLEDEEVISLGRGKIILKDVTKLKQIARN